MKRTLKLDDAKVTAIVDALIRYEGRERYALNEGALSLPALAPLVERYETIRHEEREALAAEYALKHAALATAHPSSVPDLQRDLRTIATVIARSLGHIALNQGASFECPRCGESGATHGTIDGRIFNVRCNGAK